MPNINLLSPITPGAQAAEANTGSIRVVNAFVDKLSGLPVLKTRPGLKLIDTIEEKARVDVYWWEARKMLLAVCGARLFYKLNLTSTPVEVMPASGTNPVARNVPVMFAANEYGVSISTGQHQIWWDGKTNTYQQVTDSNAPANITGLTYLKGYTIASELNTQSFAWATYGPTDDRSQPPVWNPLRLSASASPDDILAMASGWEELVMLGRESVESQYVTGDSTVPFKSLQGSQSEVGIINRNVLAKLKSTWIYATPNRQVVILDGRVPRVISTPIEYKLQEMEAYDDCEAFTLFDRFYILNFKSENRSYVFDTQYRLWYNWETWDTKYKIYRKFLGVTSAHAKSWAKHIVGGYKGQIYESDYSYLLDDTQFIRGEILSANIDHGTEDRKFVDRIVLRLRRGY